MAKNLVAVAREQDFIGNKLWEVSWGRYTVVMMYNKRLLKKFGLEPPVDWADWKAQCKKILAAGTIPISMAGDGSIDAFFFTELATAALGRKGFDGLLTVARSTSIPVATGERLFTRWGFREVLEKQAAAILQPDLCHAGGIGEVRKIANMAETYYAAVAPHNPLGPISLAAGLQVDACIPNFLCQEQVTLGEDYLQVPFVLRDGYIDLPTAPGLGITLNDEAVSAGIYDGSWDTPRLFHADDGSFAEW